MPDCEEVEPAACRRRLQIGAERQPDGAIHVRVWAPAAELVELVIAGAEAPVDSTFRLCGEGSGYHSGVIPVQAGQLTYRFRLDGKEPLYPDPASRFQPDGPHGASQLVDPSAFAWTDQNWGGPSLAGQVVYEMHVGTFTSEGNWMSASEQLEELADIGITLLELMPVAEFPGRFGWGYDGVNLFAPSHLYGTPDDLRRFIDRAHAVGIGVILDVVYNHLGPDGNYLDRFSPDYFTDRHKTDWGAAINYDGPNSGPVREFFAANAALWIDEYHFDGLRIDATQDIFDDSPDHILAVIGRAVRTAARGRSTIIIIENEPQQTRLIRPADKGGYGLDAAWNDDFHHTAMVTLTGRSEAYYTDYRGSPQEFVSCAKHGYLYQGQRYLWQQKRRGTSSRGLAPEKFVNFIQNHDQIANSGRGLRVHELCSPAMYRTVTAVTLLFPGTPMLFQGQEFASSNPFHYFADHQPELAKLVHEGRRSFMKQFRSVALSEVFARLPDPADPMTFARSKLDFNERHTHAAAYALHRDLLTIRREDPVIRLQGRQGLDGAVLSHDAFVLRYFSDDADNDRLLVVNLGIDLELAPAPEPLLAPCNEHGWINLWSSEDLRYGGSGTAPLDPDDERWHIPGRSAVLLRPYCQEIDRTDDLPPTNGA